MNDPEVSIAPIATKIKTQSLDIKNDAVTMYGLIGEYEAKVYKLNSKKKVKTTEISSYEMKQKN